MIQITSDLNNLNQKLIFSKMNLKDSLKSMLQNVSMKKLYNLLSGVAGIYVTYFLAGYFHESMLKNPYYNTITLKQSIQEDVFTYPLGFMIFPTMFAWFSGFIINSFNSDKTQLPVKNVATSALMVVISTITFTIAIYYTNFPIVMMFKSCNLLSIILVALLCSRVKTKSLKLGKNKLIVGTVITFGIILFNFAGDQSAQAKKQQGNIWIGLPLLIVSFIADGFLPDFQAEIKDKYKPRPLEMFEKINQWACIISLSAAIVYQFQIKQIITFMYYHPRFSYHLLIMSAVTTIGQMFVYRMLTHFKQHIVPFVITTRKIFTVLISIIFYNHKTTTAQYLAIAIVFFTVTIQFLIEMSKTAGGEIQHAPKIDQQQNASLAVQMSLEQSETKNDEK